MKRIILIFISVFSGLLSQSSFSQTILASGEQPQVTVDGKGVVRVIYGVKSEIFFAASNDKGSTFSQPVLVGEVAGMHLGMTRGPQLASSKDFSVITAMDKSGNIHCFRLDHRSGKWEKIENVNDMSGSAPEGLMSVAADDHNNFYAVWLDLRQNRRNNICFASLGKGSRAWSTNSFVYTSAESHVCECCKPSIAVNGGKISIMFRNWLRGSRDLYLVTSSDAGKTFSGADKLGNGTWVLQGCPMDGGGLAIDKNNNVHTAWQRERIVFYVEPGSAEQKIGEGRSVGMSGELVTWDNGSNLVAQRVNGKRYVIGEGTALKVQELRDKTIFAIWENNGEIIFRKIQS
jgi:hypothetical protein